MIQEQVNEIVASRDYWRILFLPNFSSKEAVSEVSGRGVGMDSLMTAVKDLNGYITVETELEKGTTIGLHFPLPWKI